jgi:hypothetical protein
MDVSLSSELGTYKTVRPRSWSGFQVKERERARKRERERESE